MNMIPIWSSIIKSKYGCGFLLSPSVNINGSGSNFWRDLFSTRDLFCNNTIFILGDGTFIKFWHDLWVQNYGSLMSNSLMDILEEMLDEPVADYVNHEIGWLLGKRNHLL